MKRLLAIAVFLVIAPLIEGADLSVRVVDAQGRPSVGAVVWVIPTGGAVLTRGTTAIMDQRNRQFVPHVLPVQVGTSVNFPNSDNIRHQVYSFSPPKRFQLPLYIGTPANPIVFDKPGVVSLGCNIHDDMSAWIIVVETPHFGMSDRRGWLEMERLGAGDYEVHVWHPRMTRTFEPIEVTIAGESGAEITVAISAR